jgi:hypothetical protein
VLQEGFDLWGRAGALGGGAPVERAAAQRVQVLDAELHEAAQRPRDDADKHEDKPADECGASETPHAAAELALVEIVLLAEV